MPNPSAPAEVNLRLQRWVPFDDTIAIEAVDLTGAALSAQFRLYPDAPGAPLIDLSNANAPGQGLSVSVDLTGVVPVSTIRMIINEPVIEALLPFTGNGAEPCEPVGIAWAMHITAPGLKKFRWIQGLAFIEPGANQA